MSLLLREAIGDTIRRARTERRRTLRDVSSEARVSLGYLSEVERGRKEPSSELLAAICEALSLAMPDLLDDVADAMRPEPVAPVVPARLVSPARRVPSVVPAAGFDDELRSAVEEAMEGADAAVGDASEDTGSGDAVEPVDSLITEPLAPDEPLEGDGDGVFGPADDDESDPVEGIDGVTVRLVPLVTVGPMDGPVVCSAA